MSKKDDAIFESLLVGGILGATLAALISKNNNGQNSVIGAIAGAAILASVKANENARKTEIPLIIEEDHALYKVYSDGTKKLIKQLPKSKKNLPKRFTLK